MEVQFYKLLKIDNRADIVADKPFTNTQNIHNYILELINSCVDNRGDREYMFDNTLQTTKNHIDNIIQNNNRYEVCKLLVKKLLAVENELKRKLLI